MTPLDQHELKNLALPHLVRRMDEILFQSIRERYGQIPDGFPVGLVSDIVNTKKVSAQSDEQRRRIAYLTFSYLVQVELHLVSGGFSMQCFSRQTTTRHHLGSPLSFGSVMGPFGNIRLCAAELPW